MVFDMAVRAVGNYVRPGRYGSASGSQRGFVVCLEAAGLTVAPASIPVTFELQAPASGPAPGIKSVVVSAHSSQFMTMDVACPVISAGNCLVGLWPVTSRT